MTPGSCSLNATAVYRALPLVCRSWRQLSLSPQLLRELIIYLRQPQLPRLRSLHEWLVLRAAGHVRQLELKVESAAIPLAQQGEWHVLVTAMLASCGVAGSLERLALSHSRISNVQPHFGLHLPSAAVVALRTLRR